ncbi:lamin tail domain-containing protein [Streptomyces sp. NPDC005195]|uniref:lamin tail domain-containing protein n=1 Tax=Streptomyces sp. NPDC005195 TaxID=3154561 RepID=UPI0033B64DAD
MSASASVRRLAAAALTVAAVAGAGALPASAADHAPRGRAAVKISRVLYDSPGRDDRSNRSLNDEWVALTNTTRRAVNLDGWTVSDRSGHTYSFRHYRLDGRSTVRFHTGVGRDTFRDVYQDRRNYVWDNRSDSVILRNDHRRVVDVIAWGGHRGGRH